MIRGAMALFYFGLAGLQGTLTWYIYQETHALAPAIACWFVTAFLIGVSAMFLVSFIRERSMGKSKRYKKIRKLALSIVKQSFANGDGVEIENSFNVPNPGDMFPCSRTVITITRRDHKQIAIKK